jgi:hypothetical protein
MNGDTSLHHSDRPEGTAFGLKLLTVVNAALYFVGPPHPPWRADSARLRHVERSRANPPGNGGGDAHRSRSGSGRGGTRLTWAAYVFALIGTVFGLTVALLRGLQGLDIWIHTVMLAGLAGGFVLLSHTASSRGVND